MLVCLPLMLVSGGAARGQTVNEVERNRVESTHAAITGSTTYNIRDGITYTFEGAGLLASEDGGALKVDGAANALTIGPAATDGTGKVVFIGNSAWRGGAITAVNNARLNLTNARFGDLSRANAGNRSLGDHGGAININTGASLTLRNAEFYRNVSERGVRLSTGGTGGGFGGAIYIIGNSTLEIHDSTFGDLSRPDPVDFFSEGWTAAVSTAAGTDRGTGNWAIDGHGGAIGSFASGATRIFIYNSQFYHNTAVRAALNANGYGGALALGNGGSQQATIEDSLFYGNRARGGAAGGGAIYVDGADVILSLKDTVFTNNLTTANGGAIYMNAGRLNLIATRDLAYEGNFAATGTTDDTPVATKGGFLYLNGSVIANIDIAPGATLTIGGTANAAHDTIAGAAATAINVNSGASGGTGGGTLVLHAANTSFNGSLAVHAGAVLLGGTAARLATGSNTIAVKTGGTFGGIGITRSVAVENGGVFQVGGAGIEGAEDLYSIMVISDTLRLDAGATITGHGSISTVFSIVNSDTVAYANAIVLGTAAGDWVTARVAADDTLGIIGTGSFSGTVAGAGGLVKTGAGRLNLFRAGSYTGGTRLEEGTLGIASADVLGTGTLSVTGTDTRLIFVNGMDFTNTIDIAGAVTLTAGADDVAMQGAITGDGTLVKTGTSGLMLNNAAAAFNGTVVVNQGILSGDINAASAVRFETATYAGDLVRSTGQLLAGSGSIVGDLVLNGGRLSFDFRDSGTDRYSTDWLRVSGSVTSTDGNLINLDNVGAATTYTLLRAADLSGLNILEHFTVATINGEALTNRYDPVLSSSSNPGAEFLSVSPGVRNLRVTWTCAAAGAGDGAPAAWDTAAGNWTETSGERYFRDGDSVVFAGAAATGAIVINAAGVTVGDLAVETAAGHSLAFTGGGITGTNEFTDSNRHEGGADGFVYLGGDSTAEVNGKLVKTGEGTLVFANAVNTFAGGIEIGGGTLAFDNDAQLGGPGIRFTADATLRADGNITTLAAATTVTVDGGKTAVFDTRENSLTLTGTLDTAATSTIAKTGAGDLWLAAAGHATHLGATDVREGRLLLAGTADLGPGAVTVAGGATFGGSGTARDVTVLAGAVLQAGTPDALTAERLTVSSTLTLHAGAQVNFSILTGSTDPRFSVNSSLSASALAIAGGAQSSALTIDLDRLATGAYDLGNLSALSGARITYFGQELGERQKITYDESAADSGTLLIKIVLPNNEVMRWTGATDGNWNINTHNWRIDGGSDYSFGDGDKLLFDGEADADNPENRVITIAGRRMTLSDMDVSGTANYVFRGAAEIITDQSSATDNLSGGAQGKLTKSGAGTLAFENAGNLFTGGVEITGGAVTFTDAAQLRTAGAGITLASGTLRAAADLMVFTEEIKIAAGKSGAIDTAADADAGAAAAAAGAGAAAASVGGINTAANTAAATATITAASLDCNLMGYNPAATGATAAAAAPQAAAAGHTLRLTGPLTIDATGTLIKTGAGALELMGDYSTLDGSLHVAAGELLLRNDGSAPTRVGGPVTVAVGATFGGEGAATGAVTVGQGGALRIGASVTGQEKLQVDDLRMAGGSFIYGSGELAGAMTIGDAAGDWVTLNNIAGYPVTLTATTSGAGTLVKEGGGVLTLSGTAALGHQATRIAGGLVYLRDIAAGEIPTVAHAFDLAGGWLDLSDALGHGGAFDYGDVPFVTWDKLTFTGDAGGVIGHGDAIKLGNGDTGFQIGGTGAGRGVFVVVDAGGSGTATLSGSSNYVGYTRVDGGVLAVSHDTNLGNTDAAVAAPRDVILNGGDLLVTGNAFASGRKIELRQAGAVTVAAGGTAGILDLAGAGAFTKAGEGTLFLDLPDGETSAHTGAKTVAAGVLQGRAGALSGLINNSGTVALHAATGAAAAYTGTVAGGVFAKTGDGTAELGGAAALNNLTALRVEDGILASGAAGGRFKLTTTHSIDIGDRGTLSLPHGGELTAPALGVRNQGTIRVGLAAGSATATETLDITGNYLGGTRAAPGYLVLGLGAAEGGRVLDVDTFHVTGTAGGVTYVRFEQAVGARLANLTDLADSLPLNLISVDGGGGEFLQTGRVVYGTKDYVFVYEPETGAGRWRISIASEIPALLAVDAALMLANHASLAGLAQRLDSMGLLDGYKGRQGFDLWANGIYRRDRFSGTAYAGATADTYGWQAGMDYTDANLAFALGVFVEKIFSDTDMPYATSTDSTTNGFGAYITYRPSKWLFDLLIRLNKGRYEVSIPETPVFGTDTGGASIALAVGRHCALGSDWLLEPQVQFSWTRSNIDDTKDTVPADGTGESFFQRTYRVKPIESTLLRASLMLSRRLVTRRGWELRPYARAALAGEFGADTEMTVRTIGETVNASHPLGAPYANSLGGAYGTLNGGATLRIADRFDLWTDFAWQFAGKIDGYSLNLGAGWRF